MNRECRNDSKSSPTSLTTFPVISKNELTCSSLKHLASNNNLYNNDASNSNSVNERKFKTKVESFPKMHSIQENVDYEMNMKLPKYITNYKNKQTKYLLNLTQSKYKKRRSFSFLDYSVYKTNSYYYYNNRESDANENYASFYRSHNYYHNNSSIKSSIHYKRSEYGRFKRSKDSGPSLADVPMNVDFNTSNPSYTSNRYHVFSFEQVKRLDAVMNSYVNIAPKPRLQNLIDTDTSEVIQESSSCFCTQEPYVCYIEGRISAGITEKTPSQFSKLPSTRTENATDNNSASDVITPEPFRTATTVPSVNSKAKTTCSDILCYEKCKAHTAKPVSSPDLHSQNKCAFHSHIHPPTNASVNPFLIPPKLPTIRVQLKKLIKTVRDRLVEESVPVKEIRINGGAAGCIVGSQNKPTFSDIDLIFRVDLSNSATCTKIKSVVFASMEHILVGMEKLSHSSRSCTYCCNCTLPFTMSPTQIPRDPASSYCLPCTCCLCHPFNKCFHLNKENFEDAKSNTHSTYDISKHKHNFSYSTSSESSNYRQPLHENDLNTVQLSNISNENSSQPRTHQKSEFHQKNENQTEKCNLHYCTSYHPLSALHPYYLYDSCLQPVACSMCSKQLNCLYHSKNNKHISNSNDHNNNTPCTGNSHIDIIVKQYIQKTYRVFKLNSKTSDSWLSFSVGYRVSKDNDEKIINIKFIDRMHRQFEFTVDSFQIVLDSLLTFYDSSKGHSQQMNENFYPTLVAESVSGSYVEALAHLNDCVIATHRPEEIHGGGLLKYCKLLVEGYKQSETIDVISMEKYMCSRFFIDFPDILSQYHQMNCFLMNYFENDSKMKANYLNILYEVVSHSTICLMTHERQQTLCLIQMFLRDVTERQQNQHQRLRESQQSIVHLQEFSSKDWALDKVFYGTNYFPKQMYSVSEENAVYDSNTKRNPTRLETSKQLSAKNNSAISKSTPSKVKSNQAKLEKVQEDTVDGDSDQSTRENKPNHSHLSEQLEVEKNCQKVVDVAEDSTVKIKYTLKGVENQTHRLEATKKVEDEVDTHQDDNNEVNCVNTEENSTPNDILSKNCLPCIHHLPYPQFPHYQHSDYHYPHQHINEIYYTPQLVTYFPASDYLLPSSMNNSQSFCSVPYDGINYNHQSTNVLSNNLPHYHAKIILPQNTEPQTTLTDTRHYVGVPCSYPSITYPNYCTNGSYNNDPVQTRGNDVLAFFEPFVFFSPTNQNYYVYPTTSMPDIQQHNLPAMYNYII